LAGFRKLLKMPANHTDLEIRLWGAAAELRANSKLKSSEYSVPVLGLIFLRYADHKFTQAKAKLTKQATGRRTIGRALDWRKQQATRAMVFTTIPDVLDQLPRAYTKEMYEKKCEVLFQHFYEAYMGLGRSLYAVN